MPRDVRMTVHAARHQDDWGPADAPALFVVAKCAAVYWSSCRQPLT
jgi:hypothetical protein